ncbi:MAG: hypothetical protein D6754_07265 [Alphaproteobacteria bacterium]|nr:MAG: hypothetical protein D6754_07265 [Alphaproteobacteria bacterium]
MLPSRRSGTSAAHDHVAWTGLTPCPASTGGKVRAGHVSRGGNTCLRRLRHLGAMAPISARRRGKPGDDRLWQMLQKKKPKVVAIALANRMARIVRALIGSGERYRSVMS